MNTAVTLVANSTDTIMMMVPFITVSIFHVPTTVKK